MPHETSFQDVHNFHPDEDSKKRRLQTLKEKTKDFVKSQYESEHPVDTESPFAELEDSPAFDPSKLLNRKRITESGPGNKIIGFLHATAETIVNPKKSLKARATRTTAGKIAKGRPYISRKADLEFLEAHKNLERAESSRCGSDDHEIAKEKEDRVEDYAEQVEYLQERREAMRVAWITDRHVTRVRAVSTEPGPFPDDGEFERKDDCGATEFMWGKWLGYVSIWRNVIITPSDPARLYYMQVGHIRLDISTILTNFHLTLIPFEDTSSDWSQ
jgi:hypothetical protein